MPAGAAGSGPPDGPMPVRSAGSVAYHESQENRWEEPHQSQGEPDPMTPTRWLIICGLLLGVCGGCQPREREVRNLVLTGSGGMEPLILEIGKRFESAHAGV